MQTLQTVQTAEFSALEQASDEFGVERIFWDIFGEKHEASEQVLKAILTSLGVDVSSEETLRKAVENRVSSEWSQLLPHTIVVSRRDVMLTLSIPEALAGAQLNLAIDCEDGRRVEDQFSLAHFPVEDRRSGFVRKQIPLDPGTPVGYHQVSATVGQVEASARLIVCPDRTFEPEWLRVGGKAAGIAVSLYGVRSSRNWGCGDTTDLHGVIDWVARLGGSFVALNPLHAIPNREPYNTSPYLPTSAFYRNHIYLDIERIEDFPNSAWAQRLFHSESIQRQLAALRDAKYVEYERVSRIKLDFLRVLFLNFLIKQYRHDTDRAREFKDYVEREGQLLHDYAVHAALDEWIHRSNHNVWSWKDWPPEYQDPHSPETAAFAQSHWRTVMLHQYIQWQLDRQFDAAQKYSREGGLSIGLYHDLALATDRYGADTWSHPRFYPRGARVGAPPDNFSPKGQDWSFPPPNSTRHFEDGYELFAQSIRKASAHGNALRIDHVMRFFRLYWIPDGMDATEGTYVQDRHDDLIRVLALESLRHQFIVIGEDLGTVPDYVRESLQKFGILSYRLFYFEKDRSERFYRPDEYPRQALVSATTHDLPTLAGFWESADIEARKAAGVLSDEVSYQKALQERAAEKQKMLTLLHALHLLPDWFPRDARQVPELTGELHNAIVGFLALTPCELFVLNQQDIFKETEQQNLPGTTAEHPNWRHKMTHTLEEISGDSLAGYFLMFRSWLARTGRLNHMK